MPPVSKIAQLPQALREWLHKAFVERGFGGIEQITEDLNALMKEAGVAISIGKSAVGAESQKVKRAQETIRATTEAAKLIAQTSRDDTDSRSEAAMALVQSEVFELLLQVREAEALDDPVARLDVMNGAALALSRMSRARVSQSKHRIEIETRIKAAADQVAKIAKTGGLTKAQQSEIRASILGIAKPARVSPPDATAQATS